MLHIDPAWPTLLKRGIRRGVLSLLRERDYIGGLGAIVGVCLLIQMLIVGFASAVGAERLLRERTDIRLELRENVRDREISDFLATLHALPYVERAAYTTKEQAYELARSSDSELIGFLEEYGLANPFFDAVSVTLSSLQHYRAFIGFLEDPVWQRIVSPTFLSDANAEQEYAHGLLGLTEGIRAIVLFVLAIGCCTLLFIVVNLARSRSLARSEEVLVERLAGAQTATILLPFAAEASLLLIIGIIGSLSLVVFIVFLAPNVIPALGNGGILSELRTIVGVSLMRGLPTLALIELLIAPTIGIIGAWIGIAPQVRSPRIAMAAH
jgi:cell division protein FtsX